MDITGIKAYVFSGAGTTREAAERFCRAAEVPAEVVDITPRTVSPTPVAAGELAVFAVPSYGGRVPAPALERIAALRSDGAPAVLMVTYGNRAVDDTFLELVDAVGAQGFVPVVALAVVAHHSLMVNVAVGRPDAADLACVDDGARAVMEKLAEAPDAPAAALADIPGNRPYRAFGGVPFKPVADAARCTACGACAAQCPTGAIAPAHPADTDGDLCISCMRCIAACPVGARAIGGGAALTAARAAFALKCAQRQESYVLI